MKNIQTKVSFKISRNIVMIVMISLIASIIFTDKAWSQPIRYGYDRYGRAYGLYCSRYGCQWLLIKNRYKRPQRRYSQPQRQSNDLCKMCESAASGHEFECLIAATTNSWFDCTKCGISRSTYNWILRKGKEYEKMVESLSIP